MENKIKIETSKFGQKLLNKIKEQEKKPIPKWRFILVNVMMWLFGFLSFILVSFSVSFIIYMFVNNDLTIYKEMSDNFFEFIFVTIPFFGILSFMIFIAMVYFNLKHTRNGYRYSLPTILLVTITMSVVLGGIFCLIGVDEKIDETISRDVPFYDELINPHMKFWSNAERGRLSGLIISRSDRNIFLLTDRKNKNWTVFTGEVSNEDNYLKIETGKPARFIGKKISEKEFTALKILPMISGRGFYNRNAFNSSIHKNMINFCSFQNK
ncbi:MAG: hypothetical protein NT091_02480 [Candidatus Falkowbacteria bacterium]|nr:hypothetical protein [Candidatus Falkowbacteria bacterium]